MSNNPPEKLPPHILAAGDEILRNLNITAFLLLRRCSRTLRRCRCAAATAAAPLLPHHPPLPLPLPLRRRGAAAATTAQLPPLLRR